MYAAISFTLGTRLYQIAPNLNHIDNISYLILRSDFVTFKKYENLDTIFQVLGVVAMTWK